MLVAVNNGSVLQSQCTNLCNWECLEFCVHCIIVESRFCNVGQCHTVQRQSRRRNEAAPVRVIIHYLPNPLLSTIYTSYYYSLLTQSSLYYSSTTPRVSKYYITTVHYYLAPSNPTTLTHPPRFSSIMCLSANFVLLRKKNPKTLGNLLANSSLLSPLLHGHHIPETL